MDYTNATGTIGSYAHLKLTMQTVVDSITPLAEYYPRGQRGARGQDSTLSLI